MPSRRAVPVPDGWKACQLGRVTSRITERNISGNTNVLTASAQYGLVRQDAFFQKKVASTDTRTYFLLRRGDFVYTKSYSEGYPAGVTRRLTQYDSGVVTPLYICFKPDEDALDPNFLEYYFESGVLDDDILWIAKEGVRNHGLLNVGKEDFFKLPIAIPPLREQRRIAEILDFVDDRIRLAQSVIKKREVIEKAVSIITPDSSWRWLRLGRVATVTAGLTLGAEPSGTGSVALPYLRVANVQDGHIDTGDVKTMRVLRTQVHRYSVRPGDVLLTEGGDFDKLGRGAVWDGQIEPCLHQNHIFRIRCRPNLIIPDYLALYTASPSGRRYFLSVAKQTTNLASINSSQLKDMPLPVPSLRDQERILDLVHEARTVLADERAELDKLRLLKKGLMDDLLAGKVRVGELRE